MAKALVHLGGEVREVSLSPAFSILNALVREGIPIRHACGGRAQCGTCRVALHGGSIGPGLNPMDEVERSRLAAVGAGPLERLACRLYAAGNVELTVPDRTISG